MACLTCGTTTSNKGKWNNLPPQGKKKHPNATRTIQQSETPQHIIDRLKEPSFIYEFAKGQEGKLFELSVKALEQLDARDELVKMLGEDEIVPTAVNIKTIASMLLSGEKNEVVINKEDLGGLQAIVEDEVVDIEEITINKVDGEDLVTNIKVSNPLPESINDDSVLENDKVLLPFGESEDITIEQIIAHFDSDLEAMKEYAKSNPNIKLGRANKLESVAKLIVKALNK